MDLHLKHLQDSARHVERALGSVLRPHQSSGGAVPSRGVFHQSKTAWPTRVPWLRALAFCGLMGLAMWAAFNLAASSISRSGARAQLLGASAQTGQSATPGSRYVFIYLQYVDGANPHPAYAVYHKPGPVDAPGPYQRLAVIQTTLHGPTIAALMDRATAAGFDNQALETFLDEILPPGPYPTLADKIVAFFQGELPGGFDTQQQQSMVRVYPQLALVLGQAYLARVPDSAPNTFEVRVFNPIDESEGPAVARVTSPAEPVFLPAPEDLSEKVEPTPRGHLRVHLRWCLPMELRQMAFHWAGFKLFRVPRQSWRDTHSMDPPLAMTRETLLEAVQQGLAIQVNRGLITPGADFPCPFPASDVFFVTDDNDSAAQQAFAPGGTSFPDGYQATYFVVACDLFGRIGHPSPGLEVTICDRLPPLAPSRVRVDNIYKQDGADDHALRLSWQRDDVAEVKRYHLFRYENPDDALVDRQNPAWPLTASRIAVVDNPGAGDRVAFTDTTPGALTLPADDGLTRWFVVVAEDNTTCLSPLGLGNLSGLSSPVPGALYNLENSNQPQGRLLVPCCQIAVAQDPLGSVGRDPLLLHAAREHPSLAWVEFREQLTDTFLGRYGFGNLTAVVARPFFEGSAALFQARYGTATGQTSAWVGFFTSVGPPYPEHFWTGRRDCGLSPGCPGGFIDPVDPDTGALIPTCVTLNNPPAEVTDAALFRRLGDTGPLVLMDRVRLDSNGDGINDVSQLCETAPPLNPGRACYFLQYYDRNGNPSGVVRIGCVSTRGAEGFPVPRITHFFPEHPEPAMAIEEVNLAWFCPRPGVDRFEIAVSPPPPGVTTTFQEGNEAGVGPLWGVVDSPRLAVGFGENTPNFAIALGLEAGKDYQAKVRAAGEGFYGQRDVGAWSDPAPLSWIYDPTDNGPPPPECPVPWPARAVAALITDKDRELPAQLVDWEDVLFDVGPRPTTEIWIKIGAFAPGDVQIQSQPGQTLPLPPRVEVDDLAARLTVPLPFTVYLHQTSSQSRGTMIQVSHYVDEILTTQPQPGVIDIIDRAFAVLSPPGQDPVPPPCLWFRVRHPLLAGRSYRCAVVLHGPDREPIETRRTVEITVPPQP